MLQVKAVNLAIAKQAAKRGIEKPFLESDMRACLPINAVGTSLCRRNVTAPKASGDLVKASPENGMVFSECVEQPRWTRTHND